MKKLFTAMLLVMTTMLANAQLVINELMQSNVECIMDDIKEFPDSWVELYNPTDEDINLKDYWLGTKADGSKSWQLPNKPIASKGYVIIYCDKEDAEDHPYHANFRLESDKVGNLYLFKGNEIVNSVEGIPIMPAPDVAYGRKTTDDGAIWGYELKPTPGNPNEGDVVAATQILGAPEFGQKGFVSSSAFDFYLTLSTPEHAPEGAYITYTMDGSEPTAESTPYTTSIRIKTTNNNRTKVVRAKVFCDGYLSPVSTAQSYIYHPREMKIPIISILTKNKYIYDDVIGIYPNNKDKDHQVDWRRPINIEMFISENSESVFNQLGETRIQGGQSRANKLKSMAIYANKRFGPKNKRFSYEFFPDQKPGITEFKSFSLRDGGNDFGDLYFRDLIIQRTMGPNVDLDWQAGRPAVLYINGVYKGMINIRERSNEDNIYSNYNELEDVDEIEIGHKTVGNEEQYIEELKEGTKDFYDDFWDFYSKEDKEHKYTPDDYTLEGYDKWMDVSEYLNVMITNLFYCNIDFPGNNIVFWRPNKKKSGLPMRWRFIIKDTDFGLGLYNWSETSSSSNTIDMIYNPSKHNNSWAFSNPKASLLFRNMMENTDIKNMFIDKSCVYMGDFMNAKGTGAVIDDIMNKTLDEFVAHRAVPEYYVWGGSSNSEITNKFNAAKRWVEERPDYFLQYIKKQYLSDDPNVDIIPITVTINKDVATAELPDEVLVNDIKLTKGVFDGKLFLDRLITLKASTNDMNDFSVTGWEIKKTTNGVTETSTADGDAYTFNVPSCSKLEINAVKVHKPQVTISEYGAVSFSSTQPLDFTGLPIEAYIVTAKNGNSFIKKQVYKVPANTGLVIEGAEGTYKIPVACASATFDNVDGNLLQSTASGAFTVGDFYGRVYGLFYSNTQKKVGFQKKKSTFTFGIGKSYLLLPEAMAKNFNEIFFDDATAIHGVHDDVWTDGKAYNLNGQRVDKNYKGVMIVNGKKVVNNRK